MDRNVGNVKTKALTFLLVVGLIVAATGLVYFLSSLTNIMALVAIPLPTRGGEKTEDPGRLVITAWLLSELNNVQVHQEPLNRLPIKITKEEPPVYNETLYTDTSGLVEVRLPAGDYIVESVDTRFTLSVNLEIANRDTTHLSILVRKKSYEIPFFELFERDSSGFIKNWGRLVVAVPSSRLTANYTDSVWIEARRDSIGSQGGLVNHPLSIEAIAANVLDADMRSDHLWLDLQPVAEFSTASISSLYLVSYQPSYEVYVGAF